MIEHKRAIAYISTYIGGHLRYKKVSRHDNRNNIIWNSAISKIQKSKNYKKIKSVAFLQHAQEQPPGGGWAGAEAHKWRNF